MSKAPAFQFYCNDFMDATRLWEANAVGLFIRCLCIQWTNGGVPSDLKLIARATHTDIAEVQSVWPTVGEKFEKGDDGLLRNSRLESVRERQTIISGKRSAAGKSGANAKANLLANGKAKNEQRKVKVKIEGEVEEEEEGKSEKERATTFLTGLAWNSPEIIAAWTDFEEMRKKIRKPMTDAARHMICKKLNSWGEAKAIEALNKSTVNCWQDVFEPKPDRNAKATDARRATTSDHDTPITLAKRNTAP